MIIEIHYFQYLMSQFLDYKRQVVEYKADVNIYDNLSGNVPIHYAIDFDNMKLLKLLIENALMCAVKFNPLNVVKILLDNGADPNEKVIRGLTCH